MHPLKALCFALTLGLSGALAAQATTVLPVDAAQVVDQSELIFTGQAVAHEVATTRDGKTPFTFITFAVDEVLKGHIEGDEITLRFFGGEIGEEVVEAVGMPKFEELGEYLLFVDGNGESFCPVVGWWQGKLDKVPHPQTGEKIFVDHRGVPVTGLTATSWTKAEAVRVGEEGVFEPTVPDTVQVLWQDGVEIVDERPDVTKAALSVVGADRILDQLRAAVATRSAAKSFRPGKAVASADVLDVPDSVTFEAVAPR